MMKNNSFHSRQMSLPGWGSLGQLKLSDSKVLIVGIGGLGTNLALMLAAAGVGEVGLVDFDKVDESNLSRQILFCFNDIDQLKVDVAYHFLSRRYPQCKLAVYEKRFEVLNAEDMVNYQFVFDCSDDIQTRYAINDVCAKLSLPWMSGSLHRFDAQVGLFNFLFDGKSRTKNYVDFYPENADNSLPGNCADNGVAPYFPSLVAQYMAGEFFKALIGYAKPLINEILLVDGLTLETRRIKG